MKTEKSIEFRPSSIEENSLQAVLVKTRDGQIISETYGRLYRWQGLRDDVNVYRDLDGNFKPLEYLTKPDIYDF
jgi:hypothetical protein